MAQELKQILISSHEGKHIYESYQINNFFTFYMRNKLVRIIVDYHIYKNPNEKLSMCIIQQLALSIVQLFSK